MQEKEILQNCLLVGQEAYNQEKKRQDIIGGKADYLMKYLTVFVALLNLSIPLILSYYKEIMTDTGFRWIYVFAMICLLAGMTATLLVQRPERIKLFPSAGDMLKTVQQKEEEFADERRWVYQQVLFYTAALNSLEKSNNKRMFWLKIAFSLYALIIFLVGVFFGYIIFMNC